MSDSGNSAKQAQAAAEQYSASAVQAMQSIRKDECSADTRAPLIKQLLRDISQQRLRPVDTKAILQGLVESIRSGYVPEDCVNIIANALLGEFATWNEQERAASLRDLLVSIADVGHSDILRNAIAITTIRFLEDFPEPAPRTRGELTMWLGYVLVRSRVPVALRHEVVRVCFSAMRNAAVDPAIRGKIAWVLSTLADASEFPTLPVEEILRMSDLETTPEKLRVQIKNNINRRTLNSAGYYS